MTAKERRQLQAAARKARRALNQVYPVEMSQEEIKKLARRELDYLRVENRILNAQMSMFNQMCALLQRDRPDVRTTAGCCSESMLEKLLS